MRARSPIFAAVGALALLVPSAPARANVFTWIGPSGLTNFNGNWSPIGPPGLSDETHFWQPGTYTVTTAPPVDHFGTVWASGGGHPQFSCGDPLGVTNDFRVDGGAAASVTLGMMHAGTINVGNGSLTITGNGTAAAALSSPSNFGNAIGGTATVNVNGGAVLTGVDVAIPSAAATGILNVSGHPNGGSASRFETSRSLSVGAQGVGDVEESAGASLTAGSLLLGTNGVGRLHLFLGSDPLAAPPSLVVNGTTVIGDNHVAAQPGGQGTLAIDSGNVDFNDAVSLGDPDGGADTLRMTGGTVLAKYGLSMSPENNSILDLQGGSLRVVSRPTPFEFDVHQTVPLVIDGPGLGPRLTLVAAYDTIAASTTQSLIVGHHGEGILMLRGDPSIWNTPSTLVVLGDAAIADQDSSIGLVYMDSTVDVNFRGSLSVGPGSGFLRVDQPSSPVRNLIDVAQWLNVLSGPSKSGQIQIWDDTWMTAHGGIAINGTKDSASPGNAYIYDESFSDLRCLAPLQVWSGGHLVIGEAFASIDTAVVMGEIRMEGGELDSVGGSNPEVMHLRNGGILHGFGLVTHRIVLDDSTATLAVLASDSLAPSPSKIGTLAGESLTVGDSTGTGGVVLGGTVRVEAGTLSLLNQGVLDLGPHVILSGGTLNVPHGGHIAASSALEGYGSITGDMTIDGTVKSAGGLNFAGNLNVPAGGEFSASGIVTGTVTLGGKLDMGPALARLELANAPLLQPTCAITMRIGSAAHGAQDTLVVDQPLALNGTLDLHTWQPDPSQAGDTLNLISAPSISGTFTAVTIDGVNAPSYVQVIYDPTRVRVAVLQPTTSVPASPKSSIALRFAAAGTMVNPAFALDLPRAANVHLAVFNVGGRRIAELENGRLEAGRYRFPFEQGTSGVYFGQAWVRDDAGAHLLSARLVRIR